MSTIHYSRMTLFSLDVQPGGDFALEQVFNGFGCIGGNVSPGLNWNHAPSATKSFAITIFDPDAPTGSGFWHWIVYNIPKNVMHIPKGAGQILG